MGVRGTHFAVATNEKFALGGIDTVSGERVNLDLLHSPVSTLDEAESNEHVPSIIAMKKQQKSQRPSVHHPQHPAKFMSPSNEFGIVETVSI